MTVLGRWFLSEQCWEMLAPPLTGAIRHDLGWVGPQPIARALLDVEIDMLPKVIASRAETISARYIPVEPRLVSFKAVRAWTDFCRVCRASHLAPGLDDPDCVILKLKFEIYEAPRRLLNLWSLGPGRQGHLGQDATSACMLALFMQADEACNEYM